MLILLPLKDISGSHNWVKTELLSPSTTLNLQTHNISLKVPLLYFISLWVKYNDHDNFDPASRQLAKPDRQDYCLF